MTDYTTFYHETRPMAGLTRGVCLLMDWTADQANSTIVTVHDRKRRWGGH